MHAACVPSQFVTIFRKPLQTIGLGQEFSTIPLQTSQFVSLSPNRPRNISISLIVSFDAVHAISTVHRDPPNDSPDSHTRFEISNTEILHYKVSTVGLNGLNSALYYYYCSTECNTCVKTRLHARTFISQVSKHTQSSWPCVAITYCLTIKPKT